MNANNFIYIYKTKQDRELLEVKVKQYTQDKISFKEAVQIKACFKEIKVR